MNVASVAIAANNSATAMNVDGSRAVKPNNIVSRERTATAAHHPAGRGLRSPTPGLDCRMRISIGLVRSTRGTRTTRWLAAAAVIAALATTACGGAPGAESLRESFAAQMAANGFIKDFQRKGDELSFTGPGAEGGVAKWRVHIDATTIEPNSDKANQAAQPYKGTVKSSWYSNDQLITPTARDSRLPTELTSNGLTQDCWAFWVAATKRWSWE